MTGSFCSQLGRCLRGIWTDFRPLFLSMAAVGLWLGAAGVMYAVDVFERYSLAVVVLLAAIVAVLWFVAIALFTILGVKDGKITNCIKCDTNKELRASITAVGLLICYAIGCGLAYMVGNTNNYELAEQLIAYVLFIGVIGMLVPLLPILIVWGVFYWSWRRFHAASEYADISNTTLEGTAPEGTAPGGAPSAASTDANGTADTAIPPPTVPGGADV
jgi:hypothetical protein